MKDGCKVKICGVTNLEDRDLANAAGADFFGVVIDVPYSPRSVTVETAAILLNNSPLPGVALAFQLDLPHLYHLVESCRPQAVQLLCPVQISWLMELIASFPGTDWWQSIYLPAAGAGAPCPDLETLQLKVQELARAGVNAVVLDTAAPLAGQTRYGGTGLASDWEIVCSLVEKSPLPAFLAGGVNPSNVQAALDMVHPKGIDLCSGVEASPGRKDPAKLKELIRLVRDWEKENKIRKDGRYMKAAVVHGANDIRIEEVPRPVPEPGDIVVRVKASGICATDVKTLLGQGLPNNLPTILGHEVAGEVFLLGEGVEDFDLGDRVAIYPIAVCGECDYCLQNRHNLCRHEFGLAHGIDGGFAEYVRIPRQILKIGGVVKIPPDLPFDLAALAEPLSCGLAALRANRVKPGGTVVIVGAGPMGMIHLLLAKWRGARVIIIEQMPNRQEFAKKLGADAVINPQTQDPVEAVRELTNGDGAEVVITSLSDPQVIENSLTLVKKAGIFNIFGGPPAGHKISIDPRWVHYQEITITGSFASTPGDFREAIYLIASGEVDAAQLLTDRFTLDSMLEAVERARSLDMIKGVVLV